MKSTEKMKRNNFEGKGRIDRTPDIPMASW
jgi:hypothetical protein